MSTSTTNTRQLERTTSTTSRREFATSTISSEEASQSSTQHRQSSSIQLDTATPTPDTTAQDSSDINTDVTTTSFQSTATCSSDSECNGGKICSRGTCAEALNAAPFGPYEGSSLGPTTHMSTGSAIGVGLGVVCFILLLFGFLVWIWRRRGHKSFRESIEAPAPNRNRSASSATDQKTLVASLPNSPQQAGFGQHDEMRTAALAQLVTSHKIRGHSRTEKDMFAHRGQLSMGNTSLQSPSSNEKSLPLPPNDMPLPPTPPSEEKKYAVNVNINKSMIFDDVMFNVARPARDSTESRDRMPKYRFEEYLPPVVRTPPISILQYRTSQHKSEFEMVSYPRKDSAAVGSSTDDEDDEMRSQRGKTLKIVAKEPPQLPLPELLPPPSPSFSFRSYDWYQDIIGTEQTNMEDTIAKTPTPSIPDRNPARTPTQTTFGASLSSHPPDADRGLYPPPLSPSRSSYLHPSTAALPSSATLTSPTATSFRLSPTVYTMPSRPPKARPLRASLQSTMTQKTHMSRSWLPDDGLYLPEEGTHDSYMMFKRRLSDEESRPTSYSPF